MWFCTEALIKHSIESGLQVRRAQTSGALIANNRNALADKAIEHGADYLLYIDSDMTFDPDSLVRLVKLNQNIVSGLAVSRLAPFNPVAKVLDEDGFKYKIRKDLDKGLFFDDIDMVGCAFMLINTDVLRKLKKPYFAMPPYGEGVMGEDVYFCRQAKEAGYKLCIDTSLIIGHIGNHQFTIYDHLEFMKDEKK